MGGGSPAAAPAAPSVLAAGGGQARLRHVADERLPVALLLWAEREKGQRRARAGATVASRGPEVPQPPAP